MRRALALLLITLALASAAPASADTITVDVAGGGDFLTISEGVASATSGDTVLVSPGTYSGPENAWLDFGGRDIVLMSSAGPAATIMELESGGWKRAFEFEGGESQEAVVDGFTVLHGRAWSSGGGFRCVDSSPTIRNCLFTYCSAEGEHHVEGVGGAGYLRNSQALIEDCSFVRNYANNSGPALFISSGTSVTVRNCYFTNNDGSFEGDGAVVVYSGSALVEGCTFFDNRDGAAASLAASPEFRECTFIANGEGAWDRVLHTYGGGAVLERCVFAFNDVEETIGCRDGVPSVEHCCFYESGTPLECAEVDTQTNLLADPLFCSLGSGDYSLCANSPCLPAGNPWSVQIGAHGEGCDACDSPVETTSWGAIKAMFR